VSALKHLVIRNFISCPSSLICFALFFLRPSGDVKSSSDLYPWEIPRAITFSSRSQTLPACTSATRSKSAIAVPLLMP